MKPGYGFRTTMVLCLAAALAGCVSYKVRETRIPEGVGWPPGNPRIRLIGLIDLYQAPSGGPWSTGSDPTRHENFRRPYAVTWQGDDLLVADPDAGRIARIITGGRISFSRPGLFSRPVGIAACDAGIVVTDAMDGTVTLLDNKLALIKIIGDGLSRPTGLTCGGDEIFVVETGAHRVLVFGPEGMRRSFGRRGAATGEFNFPTTIAISEEPGQDLLLVGDAMNFRIQLFDRRTSGYLDEFGNLGDAPGEMPRIKGIAVDVAGRIWVSDGHLDQIAVYDQDGTLLVSIGQPGSGPGQFSFPVGIASHRDGRVAVVDSYNRRLQILDAGVDL